MVKDLPDHWHRPSPRDDGHTNHTLLSPKPGGIECQVYRVFAPARKGLFTEQINRTIRGVDGSTIGQILFGYVEPLSLGF